MRPLGGEFTKCANALLEEAAGETPPASFPTMMIENMVNSILTGNGNEKQLTLSYMALQSALQMACPGKARELSKDEINTVIKKHFDSFEM